jgi:hypothetical protein
MTEPILPTSLEKYFDYRLSTFHLEKRCNKLGWKLQQSSRALKWDYSKISNISSLSGKEVCYAALLDMRDIYRRDNYSIELPRERPRLIDLSYTDPYHREVQNVVIHGLLYFAYSKWQFPITYNDDEISWSCCWVNDLKVYYRHIHKKSYQLSLYLPESVEERYRKLLLVKQEIEDCKSATKRIRNSKAC